MDPWVKVDYSRHIREASMGLDGLPGVVPPSGRVPGQLLLAAPILKRRRRYREETAREIYRRRGAFRGSTRDRGGTLACPTPGPRHQGAWSPGGSPPSLFW